MEDPIIIDDDGVIGRTSGPKSLIAKYLSTAAGRAQLAASMVQPLRTRLDYHAIGRRAFMVEQLPQGALPTYDRDIDISAVVYDSKPFAHKFISINSDGVLGKHKTPGVIPSLPYQGIARRALNVGRVTVPEFEIVSNPSIKISDVKRRRFNVIDRARRPRQVIIDSDGNITAGAK